MNSHTNYISIYVCVYVLNIWEYVENLNVCKFLPFHAADPNLIPGTKYSLLNTLRVIPEHRAMRKTWLNTVNKFNNIKEHLKFGNIFFVGGTQKHLWVTPDTALMNHF